MKYFGLENVKAFVDTGDIELAPITLFVGKNSCGKSSFIRFPAVIFQSLINDAPICLHSSRVGTIDYGNVDDVIHGHKGREFSFKCTYDYDRILHNGYAECLKEFVKDVNGRLEEQSLIVKVQLFFGKRNENTDSETILKQIKVYYNGKFAFSFVHHEKKVYKFTQNLMLKDGNIDPVQFDILIKCDDMPGIGNGLAFPKYGINEIVEKYSYNDIIENPQNREKAIVALLEYNFAPWDEIWNDPSIDETIIKKIQNDEDSDENEKEIDEWVYHNKDQYDKLSSFDFGYRQAAEISRLIGNCILNDFAGVKYIGPFRENPQRIYRREDSEFSNVGINGENTSSILINDKIQSGEVLNEVSKWFSELFSVNIDIKELKAGDNNSGFYQICIINNSSKKNEMINNNSKTDYGENLIDVGFGISQVLPIVTQIASSIMDDSSQLDKDNYQNINGLYIIEQPELHLHPDAQVALAKLFASLPRKTSNRHRLLIETHSEHLIRGLQLLVADKNSPYHINKDDLKIYYVHSEEENEDGKKHNGSWIEEMKIDDYGQFVTKWPSGFFDKAYSQIKEMARIISLQKRR